MTIVVGRPEMYDAIEKNDINAVIFQDPLQDEARKAKRNLVVSSFIAVLIASLNLRVTSFLGLQATADTLEPLVVKGLASLVVIYTLVSFIIVVYIDYSAWKFARERLLVQPYLVLVTQVESHFSVLQEQIRNALFALNEVTKKQDAPDETELHQAIKNATGQLRSINEGVLAMNTEVEVPLTHWKATIAKTTRLTWRLRARFASLWILDIAFPLLFGVAALWKSSDGLHPLLARLFS